MEKRIKVIAIVAVCLLVLLQITALMVFKGEQIEDSGEYRFLAIEKARSNSFYPDEKDEYRKFMANPGLINYLSVFYRISDNDKIPIAANIILVAIMAFCTYFIAWKLFNKKTIAWLALLIFSIFPAFIGEILNLRSEILFSTLAYAAIAISLSDSKHKYIYCGILLALANWVRPLGLVFLLAIILYMLLTKVKFVNYIKLVASIICVVILLGTASYISSGHFIYQSSTAGINFIMGANDDTDGSYNQTVFKEGNIGYLENPDEIPFDEKNSIWTDISLDWIKENPLKYISYIPAKLYYMYAVDTYAFSTFYNNEKRTSGSEYIKPLVQNVLRFNLRELTWIDYVVIVNQLLYMSYLILFVISSVVLLIKRQYTKETLLLLTIIVLGTGMTIITVGGARYHYPYLPVVFILAAALIYKILQKRDSGKSGNMPFTQ